MHDCKNTQINIIGEEIHMSIDNDEEICRMDILYGTKTLYPELAVRLWG